MTTTGDHGPQRLRRGDVAALAGLAFLVRAAYVVVAKWGDTDLTDEGDAIYYAQQALLNADGRWYQQVSGTGPAADHPPMMAFLLTPVAWITDGSILAERFLMVVIGTAAVVAMAVLAAKVGGRAAGLATGVIAALYAGFWVNDGLLMSESPTALVVTLVLLAGLGFTERPSASRALVLGAVGGVATLTRAELALLVVLVAAPAILAGGARASDRLARLRHVAIVGLTAGAVLAPWVGWNLARFEHPVLLSTNDGFTLAGANCDTSYYTSGIGFWNLDCSFAASPGEGDHSELDRALRRAAVEYVQDNVGRVPLVVAARLGRTWAVYAPGQMVELNEGEGRERSVSWVAMASYWALVPAALAGVRVARRRGVRLWPFASTVVLVTVVTVAFYGIVRFRVPADVSIVVLAGLAAGAAVESRAGSPADE
jgi:4-amino-4-deoxy-L-arabinose transferase-like glycosyltransferase